MTIASSRAKRLDTGLIECLLNPEAYPHPTQSIEMIETHISWVFLTGPFAYKLKKPVKLGFLDFRTLDSRLFYCQEELRLNQAWAPEIYIDVVPITATAGQALVDGDGPAIDYAVRMHQFGQDQRLDLQLDANKLSDDDMDELANNTARQHRSTHVTGPAGRDEKLTHIKHDMWENLDALEGQPAAKNLHNLRQWTARQLGKLEPVLQQRFDDGFVRECHGDLHLSNLVRLPGGITAFDCIEFGAEFRNIDVMSDIAFLVMDLVSRQRSDLAYRFLNRYLELTGDYGSMEVFTLYFVYRCLVRAKVAAIRSQERKHHDEAKSDLSKVRKYCEMALRQTQQQAPTLIAMHGLSGSGKTWLSSKLVSALPAIRVRSDIERKRMFHMDERADSESGVAQGIYSEAVNRDTYNQLHAIAEIVLSAGHSIIVDAAYLKFADRDDLHKLATSCGSQYILVQTCASDETLRQRIRKRSNLGDDASEAGLDVLQYQQRHAEQLTAVELHSALRICTDDDIDITSLAGRIRNNA